MAPPSELIVPPSKRATISRLPHASNPKLDWLHSVIAKGRPLLALTVDWKLSYAMKFGLLPTSGEKCGLVPHPARLPELTAVDFFDIKN